MPARKRLHPAAWSYSRTASFSQGVEVGETVYVAGQVGFDDSGKVVGNPGDMKAQARQTFRNIEKVLSESGATMDDVVKITCYITDVSKYADYAAVRAEVFKKHYPASATVAVAALVAPGLLVEVDAIAVKGSGK